MRARAFPISAARLALSLVLCYAAPLAAYTLLRAGGPLLPLLAYATLVEVLFVLYRALQVRTLITVLLAVILTIGAFAVYAAIDITPGSAFLAWFRLVRLGESGGTIAYMFCLDTVFFASLFAGLLLVVDQPTALFGYLFMNSVLAAVILESLPLAAVAAAVLAAFLVYRSFRQSTTAGPAPLLSALQLLVAAGVLAAAATPLMIPNAIVDRAFAVPLAGPVAGLFPGFPFLYNVPGYGHSFSPTDLGGRPALTSRPVLRVVASPGATLYLRTAVYDTYTGTGWALSETARKDAAPPAPIIRREQAKGEPAGGAAIRITVLIDFLASLPTTLATNAIFPVNGELPPLTYGSESAGYLLSIPVTAGFQLIERIGPGPRAKAAGAPLTPSDRERYLQTGKIPADVRALAARLRRASPAATIAAIRTYLAENYAYSLNVKRFRPGTDAVADFLFNSRSGYCVQFASAFTVLARLDGIPSRYVTGFLVNLPERSDSTVVTGLSAHAWSEVLLDSRWVTVEATPPMMRSSESDPGFYRLFNPTGSSATRRQLEAVMGARVPPPPVEKPPRRPIPVLPAAAGVLGLAAAFLVVRAAALALLPRRVKVRRIVRKTLRRTLAMGLPDPARRGWCAWANEAGRATTRRAPMKRAAAIVHSLFFAARPAGTREARYLTAVYLCVRAASRRRRSGSPPLHRFPH